MQGKTILILLLLVGGLGTLVWMQQEEAAADPDGISDFSIFEEIELSRIGAIQIEHIERHWQVRLECDARGEWYLTDPIAYRAADGLLKHLLGQIRDLRGLEVVDVENPARLGFDPPRAVITVTARAPDEKLASTASASGPRRVVVELGSIDVDGDALFVRVGNRVLRTRRSLDNALAGTDQDYRSRRMIEVSLLERPLEVKRTGSLSPGAEDLSFEALADGERWYATQPARVALDPVTLMLFQQQFFGTRLSRFHDDNPGPLEQYGLEHPLLRLEVRTVRGNTVALRFGHAPDDPETWLAVREGYPFIWEVSPSDVQFLGTPFENLFDYRIVRANRSDIRSVQLRFGTRALNLFRVGIQWRMTTHVEVAPEDLLPDQYAIADSDKVGDILALLDRSELATFLERDQNFVPSDPIQSLKVETEAGVIFGGDIGAPHDVQGDESGRQFRRFGEDLVALVSEELAALVEIPFAQLRTLLIHKLVEREQRGVRLARGAEELVYVLDRRANVWQSRGTSLEAREFAALIDRLLSIRAKRWLPADEFPAQPETAIEVEIQAVAGSAHRVRLLSLEDGRELCEQAGRWAEIRSGLVSRVAALFGAEAGSKAPR